MIGFIVFGLVVAVILLQRTASLAERINAKAENIAKTGRGINTAPFAWDRVEKLLQLAGEGMGRSSGRQPGNEIRR